MHVSAWIGLDAEDGDILSFTKWNELVAYIDTKVDFLYVDQELSLKQDTIYTAINVDTSTVDLTNYQEGDLIKGTDNLDYLVELDSSSNKVLRPITIHASQIVTDGAGDKFLSDDGTYIAINGASSGYSSGDSWYTYTWSFRPYLDASNTQNVQLYGSGDSISVDVTGDGFQPGMVFDLPSDEYSQTVEVHNLNEATVEITALQELNDLQEAKYSWHFPDDVIISFETLFGGIIDMAIDPLLERKGLSFATNPTYFEVYDYNGKKYMATNGISSDSIAILDITDPTSMIDRDGSYYRYSSSSYIDWPYEVSVSITPSGKAYAFSIGYMDDMLTLFDISNPKSIQYKTNYQHSTYLDSVRHLDSISTDTEKMYVVTLNTNSYNRNEYLMTYRVENNYITQISRITVDNGKDLRLYEQNGEYFVITTSYDDDDIFIYKITDSSYTKMSEYYDNTNCRDPYRLSNIFDRNGKKYIIMGTTSAKKFCIYDITDPTNMILVGEYFNNELQGMRELNVAEKDGRWYLVIGDGGNEKLFIYDITKFHNITKKVEKNVKNLFNEPTDAQFIHYGDDFHLGVLSADYSAFGIYDVVLEEQ